ncbi:MAG: glutamate-1-semialdehyde 2,1-aminomutase [Candidatus Omnitrophica bacterium]|nr:glutamate-1-semialdehyde 2,1-aminomutase [Candidatus Omnitrophota bacterium]MBU1923032.1 glutamate-1-semialdehyde 2,1-aminomutase [Candidatus Omnitrophota bacterium]
MDKEGKLFNIAKRYLVGGVDSPVRSFNYVGIKPLMIKAGKGARIYDYGNHKYIDYVLSWGVAILGHAHPQVIKSIQQKLDSGISFGTTNETEIELAKEIAQAIPLIKKIRFVSSGTEAVMGAVRLARAYTGRDKIIKFSHSYHGHADYLLAQAGSGLATLQIPSSAGVPKDFIKHTTVVPYSDIGALEEIFKQNNGQIAAVLVEPIGGNYGVLPPDLAFLKKIRILTKKHNTLVIFDEVITGFRFRYGVVCQNFGITPDLICLGKIIGGGLPIGAYGGSEKIMNNLAPVGKVYQASTFSGNPIVMQAGLSTLKIIKKQKDNYQKITDLNKYLCVNLKKIAQTYAVSLELIYYGSMFSFKFQAREQFVKFYRLMFENGIFFAPSEFESNFLSFAHTKNDIENTLSAARKAFKIMEK